VSGREERLDLLRQIMRRFADGHGIDWNDVETAFDIVREELLADEGST
jgi:hypothetical protein